MINVLSTLISGAVLGFDAMMGQPAFDPTDPNGPTAFLVQTGISTIIGVAFMAIMIGAFTHLAYDAKVGQKASVMGYLSASLKQIVPIVIVTLLVTIAVYIGLFLLVIPGIWIAAVLSVCVPAIVIERAGFGAFGRSASLTKGYRWPIVGVAIVFIAIMFLVTLLLGGIMGGVMAATMSAGTDPGAGFFIGVVVISALISGPIYGLFAIPPALIYARLREIKEGVTVDSLADVFS